MSNNFKCTERTADDYSGAPEMTAKELGADFVMRKRIAVKSTNVLLCQSISWAMFSLAIYEECANFLTLSTHWKNSPHFHNTITNSGAAIAKRN